MKTNTLEGAWLDHYFLNAAIPNVGDAAGLLASAAAGSLHLSLHSAYPGEAGDQTTSEVSYTGYARLAVARTGSKWTRSGNTISNAAAEAWGACTAGSVTARFVGIGRASSGAGQLDYIAPMGSELGEGTGKASNDTITIPGLSGLAVDDKIALFLAPKVALPGGITAGTVYFVKTLSGNDITISTTQGGATLDITADGVVLSWKIVELAISAGITPQIAIGQLTVKDE